MDEYWHLHHGKPFDGISPDVWEDFLRLSLPEKLTKKSFIFHEGDLGDACYYLESGTVRIFRATPNGKEATIFIRYPGEMLGLAEIIDGRNRKSNAQVLLPGRARKLAKKDFEYLLENHPSFSRRIISLLGGRIRCLGEQLESLMVDSVRTRLIKALFLVSEQMPRERDPSQPCPPVSIALTQNDLAAMIGSCQQTVSEILKQLQEEDIIRANRCEIHILDSVKLLQKLG